MVVANTKILLRRDIWRCHLTNAGIVMVLTIIVSAWMNIELSSFAWATSGVAAIILLISGIANASLLFRLRRTMREIERREDKVRNQWRNE